MKKTLFIFSLVAVVFLVLYGCFCNKCQKKETLSSKTNILNAELEKNQILVIAKDTAIKKYGYDVIQNELPLVAKLKYDSIWIVTGTLEEGTKGGTVYIEISRSNKKVLNITHYK